MAPPFAYASVNGEIIPATTAQVSLFHPVFLTSYGIYEAIEVDRGRPFHLEEHLNRLQLSANWLDLTLPPFETLHKWAIALMAHLPADTYVLQALALGQVEETSENMVAFLANPLQTYPPQFYTSGCKAICYEGQRVMPQCKSMNTLVNHLARVAAQKENALEAILTHQNQLYEGARSNLFVVEAETNALLTPPDSTVLAGITRDIVIQVMQNTPHPVEEKAVSADTPLCEMFLTSTSMHVLPITTFNGQPIGNGHVGPITKLAMVEFEHYFQDYLDKQT